jgi:pyruvate dehydrogenase E2 component (dihydrolipoamide acetyltransferase)
MSGIPIRLPTLGQSASDAVLVSWQIAPGQAVKAGDTVCIVETDKTDVDVVSPIDGVLGEHQADPGETYAVGTLLVEVLPANAQRQRVSPKARRLAKERGVDPVTLAGSGPGGMVEAADILAAAGDDTLWQGRRVRERRRLTTVQRAGARRTAESWRTAPHFVQIVDVDVTSLAALRQTWKAKGGGLAAVTWTALFVSALARTLAKHPHLNAAVDGDELVLFDDVNLGVAVDTPDGLVVPVVANADRRPLADLAQAIAKAAETGDGDPEPGTATVSNLGASGIRAGTAVLNPPEAVMLFAGTVEDRVVARDGQPIVRTMCTISMTFDHRVTDGSTAARFTADLRDRLEHPEAYL